MSGNPPGKCCTEGFKWSGEPVGKIADVAGYRTYISGNESAKNLLLLCPDIYGIDFPNCRLIADNFAKAGYLVAAIDYLNGDPFTQGGDLQAWLKQGHEPEGACKAAEEALAALKKQYSPEFVAGVGYCYGGTVVAHLQGLKAVDVGSWAHPSFITVDQVKALKVPLHLGLAEVDPIFTDDLREQTLQILKDIKLRYYVNIFSGTVHGFAARGDPQDPVVDEAMKKVFQEQIYFFDLIKRS